MRAYVSVLTDAEQEYKRRLDPVLALSLSPGYPLVGLSDAELDLAYSSTWELFQLKRLDFDEAIRKHEEASKYHIDVKLAALDVLKRKRAANLTSMWTRPYCTQNTLENLRASVSVLTDAEQEYKRRLDPVLALSLSPGYPLVGLSDAQLDLVYSFAWEIFQLTRLDFDEATHKHEEASKHNLDVKLAVL